MAIQTVRSLIHREIESMIDAHVHAWIETNQKTENNFQFIKESLIDFKSNGGYLVVDCSPFGCGRDGNKLLELSEQTGIEIVCVTGFHKKDYYLDSGIWNFNLEKARIFFMEEINYGLKESQGLNRKIKAGVIKIPFTGYLEGEYKTLTDAAISASLKTNAPILVHTEQGLNIEVFTDYLEVKGILPGMVALNHIDKRPDIKLHMRLAEKGYFLEYDTFLREKYNPDKNTYDLIKKMIESGYGNSIMVGSDISNYDMWKKIKENDGYGRFFKSIGEKISEMCSGSDSIKKLMGSNAKSFLSGLDRKN